MSGGLGAPNITSHFQTSFHVILNAVKDLNLFKIRDSSLPSGRLARENHGFGGFEMACRVTGFQPVTLTLKTPETPVF
jgi:hypothetical protein